MRSCKKCGHAASTPVLVGIGDGPEYTFDCFECAIDTLAPRCPECGSVYLDRAVTFGGAQFCSKACAQRRQVREAWSPARGDGSIDGTGSTPPRVGIGLGDDEAQPSSDGFSDAHVGDVIIVHLRALDRPPRRATILELRGPHGTPPYVVRWHDDDHVSFCFPGSDATLERHPTASVAGA
jgi:hypothetical protein